tara:strand:+ start:70 stop:441 length:372 start_codon:yes stop_codon:yes gene_type:complete
VKHTEEYEWQFDRVNSKGKVIFKHYTKESLEDVTDYLDNENIDYDVCKGATMLRVYYNDTAYQYFFTTGKWAAYTSGRAFPKKHYSSTGVKDFVTRFLYKKMNPDDSDNYKNHKDKRTADETY